MKISLKRSEHITTLALKQEVALEKSHAFHQELVKRLDEIETDRSIRVLIMSISISRNYKERGRGKHIENSNTIAKMIRRFSRPVIASVNGEANRYLTCLALNSQICIASDISTFSLNKDMFGKCPGFEKAKDDKLLSEKSPAKSLDDIDLINLAVPVDKLLTETNTFAEEIAKCAPLAVSACLKAVVKGASLSLEEGLKLETDLFCRMFESEDMREGTSAFFEKRSPLFIGE